VVNLLSGFTVNGFLAEASLDFLHFFFYLIVAAVCAGIASRIVPGVGKNGFLGSAVLGMIGAWVGTSWLGNVGPSLEGVPLLPAIVGSAVVIFAGHLTSRIFARFSKGKTKKIS
jgi:uncharacterized membrane protein YeaQ/YmgE (transglycosylase-associated protein family)